MQSSGGWCSARAGGLLLPRIERSWAAVERSMSMPSTGFRLNAGAGHHAVWRDALEAVQGPEQGPLL